jgi:hypothetical protein
LVLPELSVFGNPSEVQQMRRDDSVDQGGSFDGIEQISLMPDDASPILGKRPSGCRMYSEASRAQRTQYLPTDQAAGTGH